MKNAIYHGEKCSVVVFSLPPLCEYVYLAFIASYLSLVMRKPDFCICENKDADQLRGNREADQRLCFRHTDIYNPYTF